LARAKSLKVRIKISNRFLAISSFKFDSLLSTWNWRPGQGIKFDSAVIPVFSRIKSNSKLKLVKKEGK